MKKVVLAYSGGLDTSCCIQWLKDRGFDVVCFSANLGSEFSPADLRKRARQTGASKIYIKDLRREFAYGFVLPALKAGAVYEGKYLLATALGRPLIAKHLVKVAAKEKASFVAHGCSAKGNDQVRLDVSTTILNPKLTIVAPLREWDLTSRESEIDYAKKKKIPIKATKAKPYSIDQNIWGVSIEAGRLEDLKNEPGDDAFVLTKSPQKAAGQPQSITIEFSEGEPVALNGKKLDLVSLIARLNAIGAKHAIGRTDLIEDRTVGIKSREVYEAPAAWILHTAHRELESLVLDGQSIYLKQLVALKYAQLVYQGLWFSPLKATLDSFVEATQKKISGRVTLKLYKGNIIIAKRSAPCSLYKKELATYGRKDRFDRSLAKGFIDIFSMPYTRGSY